MSQGAIVAQKAIGLTQGYGRLPKGEPTRQVEHWTRPFDPIDQEAAGLSVLGIAKEDETQGGRGLFEGGLRAANGLPHLLDDFGQQMDGSLLGGVGRSGSHPNPGSQSQFLAPRGIDMIRDRKTRAVRQPVKGLAAGGGRYLLQRLLQYVDHGVKLERLGIDHVFAEGATAASQPGREDHTTPGNLGFGCGKIGNVMKYVELSSQPLGPKIALQVHKSVAFFQGF
jgi:hypothetical protein